MEDLVKLFQNQERVISNLQTRNSERDRDYERLSKEFQSVKSQLRNLNNGGGVFVRWGRMTCPQNISEQVYSGYAGGSRYDKPGGAANFVCLPPDPKLVSIQGNTNEMYGSEFGTNAFGPQVGEDIPCAVCRSLGESSVLMIPARDTCYPGWRHQYSGYLASGAEAHSSATEFICMDKHPETIPGGHRNEGGKYVYTVEALCGSLHCPPYADGGELTCVVCTK
ncbi:short-chain collagen C4-like [Saccostrea echinata]|uniref:short-chain collagen C4-like n=1 Tax=Saccostrea echinata TaxID=191078 RepID=UPI002A80F541|nr:short-chain collagen C4-like [Saccostrea echinata]